MQTRSAPSARLQGEFHGRPVTRHSLKLQGEALRLDDLWPLALAVAPRAADRWLGPRPAGRDPQAHARARPAARRGDPGLRGRRRRRKPRSRGERRVAGARGPDGNRDGERRARPDRIAFAVARLRMAADVRRRTRPDRGDRRGRVASRRTHLDRSRGAASRSSTLRVACARRVRVPVRGPEASRPSCAWTRRVERADAALVRALLPYGRLRPQSIAWLAAAFVRGTATDGVVHIAGPVKRFPFRDGGGEMRIAFDVRDVTLDYFAGFTPLARRRGTSALRERRSARGARFGARRRARRCAAARLRSPT